ncbi:hypothetical protein D9M73_121170 [compost metagenome]
MTAMSPSSTVRTVSTSRLLRIRSLLSLDTGPAIELTPSRRLSFTVPEELTCGRTVSSIPTFSRWVVRKVLLKLFDSACPVVIGISCPTRLCAS